MGPSWRRSPGRRAPERICSMMYPSTPWRRPRARLGAAAEGWPEVVEWNSEAITYFRNYVEGAWQSLYEVRGGLSRASLDRGARWGAVVRVAMDARTLSGSVPGDDRAVSHRGARQTMIRGRECSAKPSRPCGCSYLRCGRSAARTREFSSYGM